MNQITILTPTLNRARELEKAMNSVVEAGLPKYEHIIIDGDSKDDTSEIIKHFPNITFISEPDNGLYEALNKGLLIAKGEYIGWINSDDAFKPNALYPLLQILETDLNIMAVFASAEIDFGIKNMPYVLIPSIKKEEILHRVTLDSVSMNACLFRKSVFDRIGLFNTTYKVVSDRDFLFRFGLSGMAYSSVDQVIYTYIAHPDSLTFADRYIGNENANLEEMRMAHEHFCSSVSLDIRNICIKWHSRASANAAIIFIDKKKYHQAVLTARQGFHIDLAWLTYFLKQETLHLIRKYVPALMRRKFNRFRRYLSN